MSSGPPPGRTCVIEPEIRRNLLRNLLLPAPPALLTLGRGPRGHADTFLHQIIGIHNDKVSILQPSGDVHLRAQVPPDMHGPHLDDVVLHHWHKLAARQGKKTVTGDQNTRVRGLIVHLRRGEHAWAQSMLLIVHLYLCEQSPALLA